MLHESTHAERIAELEAELATLREDSEVAYVLLGLAGALAEVRSIEDTLSLAVRTVPELFGARQAFAVEWKGPEGGFEVKAHWGFDEAALEDLRASGSREGEAFPFLRRALQERSPVFASEDDPPRGRSIIAIPLVRWGQDFGGLRLIFSEPRAFTPRDSALARGVARQLSVALDNARRFNLLQGLSQFGERIGSRLRQKEVLDEVLHGAVELLAAEGAWLYFLDTSHRTLNSYGESSATLALPEKLARLELDDEPWSDLKRAGTIAVADVSAHFGRPDLSALAAPLRPGPGDLIGCLLVVYEQGHAFGAEDVEALNVLAGQAAQAIETSRRFDRERAIARSLQSGLLSVDMPEMPGFAASAIYEAADEEGEVGGDFYDILDLPDGRFGVVVGDVSGKGASAAAQMAIVKYMLRALAIRNPMPGSVLYHLNNALVKELPEDRFATLVYAILDPEAGTCAISLAGHPTPLIYRGRTGEIQAVEATGTILGAFADQNFGHVTIELQPGDAFLAYTDGLLEARRGDELYGRARLEESFKARAASPDGPKLARAVYEDARAFGRITDDTVVLSLCRADGV